MPTILTISSRVIRGMVGNTLAGFVLQRMGHRVWDVPTVIWDRHPGFGRPSGLALTGEQLASVLADFRAPQQAARTRAVMSGYFAAPQQIAAVQDHIAALRARGVSMTYCCDPICGDAPGAYVTPDVIGALRDQLLPLADVITPNRHELGLLTSLPVTSDAEIVAAARALGRPLTLVTSAFGSDPGRIGNLLITPDEVWLCEAHRHEAVPNGTGDLMTALFMGWLAAAISPVEALGRAVAGVQAVLDATRRRGLPELAIVEAQDAIAGGDLGLEVRNITAHGKV